MRNRLLLSVATAALIAGAGLASAQTMSPGREAPSPAPAAQQNAPAEKTAPMNAPKGGAEIKAPDAGAKKTGQVDDKVRKDGKDDKRAQDKADPKASTAQKPGDAKPSTSGQGTSPKSSDKSSEKPADAKPSAAGQDAKPGDAKSSTAGQGAAAPTSLSTEQRTTIRTVIKKQNVQPATNVNFTISVGTRVPTTVRFHPVPVELVQIYPSWRGYDYFLVGDQIIVVNPRTHEIVAVLDA
jgi:hypothetical protein